MITFGIDIFKLKFDVYYNLDSKLISKSFSNDKKGFEALQKLMPQDKKITIAMEATGNYGYDLAHYMYDQDMIER
jgi:transposase